MEHFLQIKILHGVATVLLFGGLLGLAFYAWRSWRTGDAARVARGFKRVRLIGWPLLGLSLLALPVSGWWLVHLAGWPLGQSWLLFGAWRGSSTRPAPPRRRGPRWASRPCARSRWAWSWPCSVRPASSRWRY